VARALADVGVTIEPHTVPQAHYRAVRTLDGRADSDYLPALARALGVDEHRLPDALGALRHLADRRLSGEILWSEPAPGALAALHGLHRAGMPVLIVTNSDGHGEDNLRDSGICQVGPGAGAPVAAVIDSTHVGHAKPDPAIFAVALARAGLTAGEVVHVGDTITTDIVGARAAGIAAIHLDPARHCRDPAHPHIRSLAGLRHHVRA
jgi:FMN phosphatase YigB (HAD superfamily)